MPPSLPDDAVAPFAPTSPSALPRVPRLDAMPDATPDSREEPAASLLILPPPADLAPLVEYVWQLTLARGEERGAVWRVVVDGYVDLAVRIPLDAAPLAAERLHAADPGAFRDDAVELLASSPAVVCGAAHAARVLPMERPMLVTGARFRLGAAAPVLRGPPAELVDGARALGDVLDGRAAVDVARARVEEASRLLSAQGCTGTPSPANPQVGQVLRALAVDGVLGAVRRLVARAETRRRGGIAPDARVRSALHLLDRSAARPAGAAADGAGADVARVARELAVSKRTLERLFAAHVGFAPRTYHRLRRVGAVAEMLELAARDAAPAGRDETLSALAHRLGFTDHAHMTREFRHAMGVTPSAYRREVLAAPLARHVGAVALERTTPLGTVGRESAA